MCMTLGSHLVPPVEEDREASAVWDCGSHAASFPLVGLLLLDDLELALQHVHLAVGLPDGSSECGDRCADLVDLVGARHHLLHGSKCHGVRHIGEVGKVDGRDVVEKTADSERGRESQPRQHK